VKCTK